MSLYLHDKTLLPKISLQLLYINIGTDSCIHYFSWYKIPDKWFKEERMHSGLHMEAMDSVGIRKASSRSKPVGHIASTVSEEWNGCWCSAFFLYFFQAIPQPREGAYTIKIVVYTSINLTFYYPSQTSLEICPQGELGPYQVEIISCQSW